MLTLKFTNLPVDQVIRAAADGTKELWMAPIDFVSDDERVFVNSLGWRERVAVTFSDSEQAHDDARYVANAINLRYEVDEAGRTWVVGTPDWDSTPLAQEAKRLVDEDRIAGLSVHLGKARFADVCQMESGGFREVEFPEDWTAEEVDGMIVSFDPPCEKLLMGVFEAEVAAVTILMIPAFAESEVAPVQAGTVPVASNDLTVTPWDWTIPVTFKPEGDSEGKPWGEVVTEILASAALDRPPAEWFNAPEPDSPQPLTVTDAGQVSGHLAVWDTCHTGFQGRCVTPPRDTDYSYFQTARVIAADGTRIPVGPLVVDDGHAPANWSVEKVIRYYADTRLAAAYVTIQSGVHGPWASGAVSHKATPGQVETLRRHALSGDWRKLEGKTRLIAAVSVNGPGFVVPEVLTASGEEVGLVTYGPEPVVDQPSDLALVAMALTRLTDLVERYNASPNAEVEITPILSPELQAVEADDLELEVEVGLLLDA